MVVSKIERESFFMQDGVQVEVVTVVSAGQVLDETIFTVERMLSEREGY